MSELNMVGVHVLMCSLYVEKGLFMGKGFMGQKLVAF